MVGFYRFLAGKRGERRGIFERRGRKGYAESAKKKIPKEYKEYRETSTANSKKVHYFEFIFFYFGCSFAFSAKPSRPLRSKKSDFALSP
jgi:hypothetical protein